MRPLPILCVVLLFAVAPVSAQVTVDLHALQALPDSHGKSSLTRQAPQPLPRGATVIRREAPTPPPPTEARSPTASPQPEMPGTVPPTSSISPGSPAEPQPNSAAPPPPAVVDRSSSPASSTSLRISFEPEQSSLSPESTASIKQLAASVPSSVDSTFSVQAYAPGKADDPSTARRVSLSRAMAVRSALVADGVPSARIFVRALGDQYGDGPSDRVDIAVSTPPGAATSR